MPTTYTTKPETLRDVADTGPSPMPVTFNPPNTVERLCEYDEGGQSGCRRTSTILALEAEFDTFVKPEMFWGFWDRFCLHDGHSYYYKGWMRESISRDQTEIGNDTSSTLMTLHLNTINSFLGADMHTPVTVDFVEGLFANPPAGFPTLVVETPQFYQCINLGTNVVTIDSLDPALLTKIKNTFTDNINPLLDDLTGKLHLVGDKIYCVDYSSFISNPTAKLGVLMIAKGSEKYTEGNAYFFPFAPLTPQQEEFIRSWALQETEFQGEVVIVNL